MPWANSLPLTASASTTKWGRGGSSVVFAPSVEQAPGSTHGCGWAHRASVLSPPSNAWILGPGDSHARECQRPAQCIPGRLVHQYSSTREACAPSALIRHHANEGKVGRCICWLSSRSQVTTQAE